MPYCNYCGKILKIGQSVCKQCDIRIKRDQRALNARMGYGAGPFEYSYVVWEKQANHVYHYRLKRQYDLLETAGGFQELPMILTKLNYEGWEVVSTDFTDIDGGAMYILLRKQSIG